MSAPVEVADHGPVRLLTLNRPERRNALDLALKRALAGAVRGAAADDGVRAIVLTGGGGVFVAGSDVVEMAEMSPADHVRERTDEPFAELAACRKPVIAAVEGYALGGGCELAQHADVVVAGEDAVFGQPEVRLGIVPGAGGTQRLTRAVGKYRAMLMVLTGEPVPARTALEMGLVSEVVPTGSATGRALQLAMTIAELPPLAVQAAKELVLAAGEMPLGHALALERRTFMLLFGTPDQRERMRAFAERRRARREPPRATAGRAAD